MPKQAHQPAKPKDAAGLRSQCPVRAQPRGCTKPFHHVPPLTRQFPALGGGTRSLGSPRGWLKRHKMTGACARTFLVQKGEFFVSFENVNMYFECTKAQKTSRHRYEMQQALFVRQHTILFVAKQRSWKAQITLQ